MIESKNITVIFQGAVDKKTTPLCIDSIKKILPEAYVVLSTWEGSDITGCNCDEILFSKDPGGFKDKVVNFTNNLLRQLVSTQVAFCKI